MDKLIKGLLIILFYGFLCSYTNLARAQDIQEDQLKAVFVYNFAHFVSFPNAESPSPLHFTFCIYGNGLFQKALTLTVEDQLISGKQPKILNLENAGSVEECKIVYIPKAEQRNYAEILQEARGKPILTVSDIENFTLNGGIIEFVRKGNKINLKINNRNAQSSGLTIKANLLSISTLVDP